MYKDLVVYLKDVAVILNLIYYKVDTISAAKTGVLNQGFINKLSSTGMRPIHRHSRRHS